ncbi:DUF3192 domain-containing protein [Shewanella sp. NIFS-20-20]|uniref:DUF3192 domain-containing protein n=1 Tax=Shewanella sp. NIFS-20-20 TaxID=2853806 RepID=UPI001C491DDD|nr:DUF3192 domain-containing protein [Shewanella sp. NIFS-20-20]MBV7315354.1 DUF3192 domain-containing protein [Shewanella sp. NIFS-20-20]
MKFKLAWVVATLFCAYVIFVAVVVLVYEPQPQDMDWQDRQEFNKQTIAQLDIGQDKQAVIALLGPADISEAKPGLEGNLTVLFYRTQHVSSDGETSREECTPLLFINNKLSAWGESSYQSFLESPFAPPI